MNGMKKELSESVSVTAAFQRCGNEDAGWLEKKRG